MTESSPGVVSTVGTDCMPGSSGPVLPGVKCKILDLEGKEVTTYDTPGELYVQGPNIVLGYLNNPKATAETFVHHADGRWLRTGDEVVVRLSPKGFEHLIIVDRIKELIKVKVRFSLPLPGSINILTSRMLIFIYRAIKSHQPNWRLTSSATTSWPTVPSSKFPRNTPARFPRPSSSSLPPPNL